MLRRRAMIAFCVVAATSGCDHHSAATHTVARAPAAVAIGSWRIRVTEYPAWIDRLHITSTSVVRTERREPRTWIATSLRFHNAGNRAVRVDLAPTSTFVGHRRLLVTSPDCGFGQQKPGAPVTPGICLTALRIPPTIAPGGSMKLTISAYVGLPGMLRLAPGSYSVPLRLSIGPAPIRSPVLTLTYDVKSDSARN